MQVFNSNKYIISTQLKNLIYAVIAISYICIILFTNIVEKESLRIAHLCINNEHYIMFLSENLHGRLYYEFVAV